MRTQICLWFVLALLPSAAGKSWAGETAPDGSPYQWGAEKDGLRIGLKTLGPIAQDTSRPRFEVAIQNVGKKPVIRWLGTMLANAKWIFPEHVTLALTDRAGNMIRLQHNWDRVAGECSP